MVQDVYSLSLLLVWADAQQNMQFLMRNIDANDHHWVWLVLIYSCQRIPALPSFDLCSQTPASEEISGWMGATDFQCNFS
jgi:hypothetical protein